MYVVGVGGGWGVRGVKRGKMGKGAVVIGKWSWLDWVAHAICITDLEKLK